MKRKLLLIVVLVGLFPSFFVAQSYQATAKLDSAHILIGDYLNVHLSVNVPIGESVKIPQIGKEMLDSLGIDFIGKSKIDTVTAENRTIFNQTITITAFDSGSYYFPAIPIFGHDTTLLTQTSPLFFEVNTIPVDTTAAFRDIKQPVRVPLTFKEILPFILITLAVAAIFAFIIYLIVRYKKKQKPQKTVVRPKPVIRPEITALKALERLKQKKLWEAGKIKLYYSELTEILRTYLEGRFEINAMEMVSSDILEEIKQRESSQELYEKLRILLITADLVKFAKWNPLPTDHDICFKNAVDFVERTAEKNFTDNKNPEPKKD